MDPNAFLELAEDLKNKSGSEAALRTSVSRSYYGLHNYLKQFIEDQGFKLPETSQKHELVYRCLYNSGPQNIAIIAKILDELREERNEADYEMMLTKYQDGNLAVLVFIKARTAYNDFQKYTGNSKNRKKITKGIAEYQKKCPW